MLSLIRVFKICDVLFILKNVRIVSLEIFETDLFCFINVLSKFLNKSHDCFSINFASWHWHWCSSRSNWSVWKRINRFFRICKSLIQAENLLLQLILCFAFIVIEFITWVFFTKFYLLKYDSLVLFQSINSFWKICSHIVLGCSNFLHHKLNCWNILAIIDWWSCSCNCNWSCNWWWSIALRCVFAVVLIESINLIFQGINLCLKGVMRLFMSF